MDTVPDLLPGRPYYYLVRLNDSREQLTLTFHSFSKLKRGDRVCVKYGLLAGEFGTVTRRTRARKGYSYRIGKSRTIYVTELPLPPLDYSVEVG